MTHPRLWGDTYWNTMHSLAALIQAQQHTNTRLLRAAFVAFVCYLPPLLPCPECNKKAPIKIMKYFGPADIEKSFETADLNALMCDIHNEVSISLTPPKATMTHEMAQARAVQLAREVNTKLMWDFVIMATRSLKAHTPMLDYVSCMRMLAVMLRTLGHPHLATAVDGVHRAIARQSARDQTSLLRTIYQQFRIYQTRFNQPCPSETEFINQQQYGRKSPLTLVPAHSLDGILGAHSDADLDDTDDDANDGDDANA